ncbi:acylneuraminate cytidylyltransferase family protein [Gammaproteobacteria bacterium]|jgi:CMP-N,N'-diacetyllegionaminic acid synthase|nr:acylneuraminate cytidylyltransferase family protein [Gammaproteobacteria bacterium]
MTKLNTVAIIPARSGSKRIPNKNIAMLGKHPMLAYSINVAIESGLFDEVICSTDSSQYAEIAEYYGAKVPFLRSDSISRDSSPDIEWVNATIDELEKINKKFDVFSILRPTSPFRKKETIQSAFKLFIENKDADSLRAIEKCSQHPGKMWQINDKFMTPIIKKSLNGVPWHSNQYKALPEIFVQNASLEIAWVKVVKDKKSISGENILPFISSEYEGFDINQPRDLDLARALIKENPDILLEIKKPAYQIN